MSKTLRHSTVSITANVYSHMTADIPREAVDAMAATLDAAEGCGPPGARRTCSPRPPPARPRR